jgi:hypothetical protein
MEELELSNIDRNSPIWGGSGCDYFSLEMDVHSYWYQYFKEKLDLETGNKSIRPKNIKQLSFDEYDSVMKEFEDSVYSHTQLKTEEYFRELWRDLSKVGFEKENAEHFIDTCNTLIREEVEWWEERTDLKEYEALNIPSLVEYHSWDVIWRLCKYHKLKTHLIHNYASKRQSVLKKDLPQNKTKKSISLNLQTTQLEGLWRGFKRIGATDENVSLNLFKSYLNGSEVNPVVTPIKLKKDNYVAVFIYLCEEYGLQAEKEYFKWREFFGIDTSYAKKQVSSFKNNHIGLPSYYKQMEGILIEIGCSKPKW